MIGDPVRHSLSPVIHNAAFVEAGLDWVFVALEVAPERLAEATQGLRALGVRGASVTMPHKEGVVALVDRLDADATALGAVNCVVADGPQLVGHNTDGAGFLAGLRAAGGRAAASLDGRSVVLGTGGAARAVARSLALGGSEDVRLVSRDPARALEVAGTLGAGVRGGTPDDIGRAELIVNATPVGMAGSPGEPCPAGSLRADAVAVDLVYHPLETEWLRACRHRGIEAVNGLPMLIHQAAAAFGLWTHHEPPLAAMEAAVRQHLEGGAGPSD